MAETLTAPWPIVSECYGKATHKDGGACAQCNGSHEHVWVAWKDAPDARYGVPVRCRICGTRKCDLPECSARRHHIGPHEDWSVPMRYFTT